MDLITQIQGIGYSFAKYEYYVSDIPEKFASIAEEFLKKEIDDIKSVKI